MIRLFAGISNVLLRKISENLCRIIENSFLAYLHKNEFNFLD